MHTERNHLPLVPLVAVHVLVAVTLAFAPGCGGPDLRIDSPDTFKRFESGEGLRLITADGVRMKAREVANYPKADLPFWTDAMGRHLEARGYKKLGERCFATKKALKGCTLDFMVPRGASDWVLSETIFVDGERLLVVEVAGPYDRWAPLQKDIAASLETFDLGE